jgi:predicted  nucleic acid-binding Zn-ribbon protein
MTENELENVLTCLMDEIGELRNQNANLKEHFWNLFDHIQDENTDIKEAIISLSEAAQPSKASAVNVNAQLRQEQERIMGQQRVKAYEQYLNAAAQSPYWKLD